MALALQIDAREPVTAGQMSKLQHLEASTAQHPAHFSLETLMSVSAGPGTLPLKVNLLALDYGALTQLAEAKHTTCSALVEGMILDHLTVETLPGRRGWPIDTLTPTQFAEIIALRRRGRSPAKITNALALPSRPTIEAVRVCDAALDQIRGWQERQMTPERIASRLGWPVIAVKAALVR